MTSGSWWSAIQDYACLKNTLTYADFHLFTDEIGALLILQDSPWDCTVHIFGPSVLLFYCFIVSAATSALFMVMSIKLFFGDQTFFLFENVLLL